jgi:hypothetical protein
VFSRLVVGRQQARVARRRPAQTYSGDLVVVAVPKGSVWSLTLSDLPNPRSTHATHAGARKAAAMIKAATSPAE